MALCTDVAPHATREQCGYKPHVATMAELHGLSPYPANIKYVVFTEGRGRALLLKDTVHENFMRQYMGMKVDTKQYRKSHEGPSREFVVGEAKYDDHTATLDLHDDKPGSVTPELVELVWRSLLGALPAGLTVRVALNSEAVEEIAPLLPMAVQAALLREDERWAAAGTLAIVGGVAFGRLTWLDGPEVLATDLVVSQASPADLPLCAGLVTGAYQSALSHASILSRERHTPLLALANLAGRSWLKQCMGRLSRLHVAVQSLGWTVSCVCERQPRDGEDSSEERCRALGLDRAGWSSEVAAAEDAQEADLDDGDSGGACVPRLCETAFVQAAAEFRTAWEARLATHWLPAY